jgi:hypothetical protein
LEAARREREAGQATRAEQVRKAEHAGYFFMITGESSTQRVFATGDNTAVSGVTVGVYLFRNATLR